MYTSFYNLDNKPFELNPDPSFLWLGEKHKEIFATLRYGILENKGFLLLTGAAGSGKTILIKALTESLDKGVEWAVVIDPRLERIDFYNAIARGFGMDIEFTSKVQFLIQFSHFLHKADDENKKVLLLVDDCHRLSQEMLEELRLLSNIEKADIKLINIFFVGQPEFNEILVQPRNRAVRQRLTLKVELQSLDVNETDDYIRHRLKVAGAEGELFNAKAVQAVHQLSQGNPRRINAICDHALESGAVQGKQTIDDKIIESCVQKMDMPAYPIQEGFDSISAEKNGFDHFNGRFIPKPAPVAPSISGFNLENENQHNWLKYGLGLLVLLVAGIYFWFSTPQSIETTGKIRKVPVEIAKEPVMKGISQVSSSPAVTILEENKSEINGKKEAELKTAILEKAYSNNGKKEETKNLQIEDTLVAIGALTTEVKIITGKKKKQLQVEDTVVGVGALTAQVDPQVEAKAVERVESLLGQKVSSQAEDSESVVQEKQEVALMAPLEPRKIILGLQPNSLKLTNAAQKEFDLFVEKLKLYPRATVLVKGFVSAKSNSPENIILSEERAMSVQKLMLAKGIDAEQIEVVGMGNQEPIASNNTSKGRRQNRRVELVVINDGITEVRGD